MIVPSLRRIRAGLALLVGAALLLGAGHLSRAQTSAPLGTPAPLNGSVAAGQALAFDRAKGNCLACHTMKGGDVPSNVGPELSHMKTRFPDRDALAALIWDEETRNPQTVMPAFGKNLILDRRQISDIIDFLYTL